MKLLKQNIYDSMVYLANFYGNEKITPERIKAYSEMLSDELTPDELKKALRAIVKTSKFFPTVAEIIETARPKINIGDEANIIANEIVECISRFGPYQAKEARDYMGDNFFIAERYGWSNLCNVTYDELGTVRAQLRELAKAYLAMKERNGSNGLYELENQRQEKIDYKTQLNKLTFEEFANVPNA